MVITIIVLILLLFCYLKIENNYYLIIIVSSFQTEETDAIISSTENSFLIRSEQILLPDFHLNVGSVSSNDSDISTIDDSANNSLNNDNFSLNIDLFKDSQHEINDSFDDNTDGSIVLPIANKWFNYLPSFIKNDKNDKKRLYFGTNYYLFLYKIIYSK